MEKGLRTLERTLGIRPSQGEGRYARLRAIGSHVLATLEEAEGLRPDPSSPLSQRIPVVRRKVLERVAEAIGAELDDREPPGEQLHHLYNELKSWVGVLPEQRSDYEERLHRHRTGVAAPLFVELLRLHNFVAVSGDYVAAEPTAERFLEVLGRLQKEVLGRVPHQAPLAATVRIAPPIRLEERYEEYRQNKREVVAAVTRQMRDTIHGLLGELAGEATPIDLRS